jgi:hypothetical protein
MTIHQHATLEDTVYFWFGSNDTSGSGDDGAAAAADVRLAGAAAGAAPVLSPAPTLLSHANYPAGCYEIAVAATAGNGFAATNTYAVFCTLTVDGQNPSGFVGSFTLDPIISNVQEISDDATAATNAEAFFDGTGYAGTGNTIPTVTTLTGHTAQTGDSFARLGAPAGASVSADIAVIEGQTDDIGVAGAGLTAINLPNQTMDITGNITGNLSGSVGSVTGAVGSVTGHTAQTGDNYARLGAPAGASVSADIADVPTVAEFNARTIAAASYFDPTADAVANVTLVATTTTNTDMLTAAAVNAEVVDALNVDTYAEPGQGAPAATASLVAKIGYLYKAWRNKKTSTATASNLYADDGTTLDQKSTISDDTTTFTYGEFGTGA